MRDEVGWQRLGARLADLAAPDARPRDARLLDARLPDGRPPGVREAAALALLAPGDAADGGTTLVYTRRRDDLRAHPGQVSFPGGRVDPGETVEQAAVREAAEEVALDPATVTLLGRLPPFYIPPSRFWLTTVVARWDRPHPLVAAEAEVGEVLVVPVATLLDPDAWRAVRLRTSGWSWGWRLDDRHLLWGATGLATAELLDVLAPGWSRGRAARDLPEAYPPLLGR